MGDQRNKDKAFDSGASSTGRVINGIMTWNYRVVHRVVNGEDIYAVHEAYYEDDKPISITQEPVDPPRRNTRGVEGRLRVLSEGA